MDLRDQLKALFPDHIEEEEPKAPTPNVWMQEEPLLCKYEKRKGKPITIIEGYTGADADFKVLVKEDTILIQGDYRDTIMQLLKEKGFNVKRVGG